MIKIISDGIYPGSGTRVLNADGKLIQGVTRIEILPMDINDGDGSIVQCKLTCYCELDILAKEFAAPPDVDHLLPSWRGIWKSFRKWIAY